MNRHIFLKGLKKAIMVLFVLIVVASGVYWYYWSYYLQPPYTTQVTSTSIQTVSSSSEPMYFYETGSKACTIQNSTTGENLSYLITINVINNLNLPVNPLNVTVTIDSLNLSGKGLMVPTLPMWPEMPVWAIHGSSLSVSFFISVEATSLGYPNEKITGATVSINILNRVTGQPLPVDFPLLYPIKITLKDAAMCPKS